MKKKGFTLIELLVVIAIIAMLMAILMPALSKVKKIAMRVVCGTNLKGLGTAQTVYANDYDDEYTVQGAGLPHTWTPGTKTAPTGSVGTAGFQNTTTNVTNNVGTITVGASLYLLVREADVSPKSFVCPSSDQQEFSGKNAFDLDIVELFDFGYPTALGDLPAEGPARCVSYSYQMPYAAGQTGAVSTGSKGRYAADGTRSAAFAVMADRNPWFDEKLINGGATVADWFERVTYVGGPTAPTDDWENIEKWRIQVANAQPHDRESQNVLYADGHSANENRADVGIKNDCIYTPWSDTTTEAGRRRGTAVLTPATQSAPQGIEDSMLVNDL